MLDEINGIVKEMKCFNCIHAPVCFIQKGGVNLQLVDSTDCEYYQQKTPEDSVLISKEELLEIANDYEETAMFHLERQRELDQVRTQAIKEFAEKIKAKHHKIFYAINSNDRYFYNAIDEIAKEFGVTIKG